MKFINMSLVTNRAWNMGHVMPHEARRRRKRNKEMNLMRKGRIGEEVTEYKIDIEHYKKTGEIIKLL